MNILIRKCKPCLLALALSVFVAAGLMPTSAMSQNIEVRLDGTQEVPPVTTAAVGSAAIPVAYDKSVSGTITTSGIDAKAAHIHNGEPGVNGPIIIPFVKTSENTWAVAEGAILTDEQLENYKAGNLYINVHSDQYPAGEIRGQIRPM